MKKLTLLITILALLVSAGATFAQDEAQPDRPNPDRLRERVCNCVDESLKAMADDLGISMEELEAALYSSTTLRELSDALGVDLREVLGEYPCLRRVLRRMAQHGDGPGRIQQVADALGMTTEDVREALSDGSTIRELAEERGIEMGELFPEATARTEAVASALGLTVEELQTAVDGGATIRELAEAAGIENPRDLLPDDVAQALPGEPGMSIGERLDLFCEGYE